MTDSVRTQRVTVTVPASVYQALLDRSSEECRSMSNLVAYLLECTLGNSSDQKRTG